MWSELVWLRIGTTGELLLRQKYGAQTSFSKRFYFLLQFVSIVCFVFLEKRPRPVVPISQANPVDPEGGCTQKGRNLPQDIPSLLPSKCHDSITTGYGSFGTPAPFLTAFS